jgi:S1-C subfamily serine protease
MSASPLLTFSNALVEAVRLGATGIVSIQSRRSRSSGFLWRPGLIVAADEALAEEGPIHVTLPGGDRVLATVSGRDPTTDIALLRIEHHGLPVALLDTVAVEAGALALAVGAQEGLPVAALGIVARVGPAWLSSRGGQIDQHIELSLPLRPEAEGGLALDSAGRGFGMVVFGPRRRVLVIPAATIERVAERLMTHGRIARGYLGLGLQPVRLDAGEGLGLMVIGVDSGGPGATAGFHQGDVLVTWGGQPIAGVSSLMRTLGPESIGMTVPAMVRRAGQPVDLRITIGERPAP